MQWIVGFDWLSLTIGFCAATVGGWPVVAGVLQFCNVGGSVSRASIAIGIIERGLVFGLSLAGEFIAITVLIGIKSIVPILDDSSTSRDQIVLGTLSSFGWAIVALLFTIAAISRF